jgi:hypothetical protein
MIATTITFFADECHIHEQQASVRPEGGYAPARPATGECTSGKSCVTLCAFQFRRAMMV